MPNNRKITKKTIKGKEGLHPGSRKAGQLSRVQLRTVKLQTQAKVRRNAVALKLQRPLFFLHSLSSPSPISFDSLQALVEIYINRHDDRISELTSERRSGRPKEKELLDLEEAKRRDTKEWETGFEVPDLTDALTARLMYSWIEADVDVTASHLDLLRYIRVSKGQGEEGVVVSKKGNLEKMGLGNGVEGEGDDWRETNGEEKKQRHSRSCESFRPAY